jgi:hypothetical protein
MDTFEMKHGAIASIPHEAIATIAAEMNARLAALQADSDLTPEDRVQLSQAVRTQAQVELGQMAGVAGVDQAALAQVLAEFVGPIPERAVEPLQRPWWKFWSR